MLRERDINQEHAKRYGALSIGSSDLQQILRQMPYGEEVQHTSHSVLVPPTISIIVLLPDLCLDQCSRKLASLKLIGLLYGIFMSGTPFTGS